MTGHFGPVDKPLYAVHGPRHCRLTVEVRDGARMPGATVEVRRLGQTYVALANPRGSASLQGIYGGLHVDLRIIINGSARRETTLTLTKNTR